MWVAAYIGAIVGLNWLFNVLPPIATPFGGLPLATLIVGAVFVLRDYAQRRWGHWCLAWMGLAAVLSYALGSLGFSQPFAPGN